MMFRSLRSRLLVTTAVVLIALAAVAWLVSTVAVKRELSQFLVTQRMDQHRRAAETIRSAFRTSGSLEGVRPALAKVFADSGNPSVVIDGGGRVVAAYPDELNTYQITVGPGGELTLRRDRGGRREALVVKGGLPLGNGATAYLLPAKRMPVPVTVRSSVQRWLFAGVGIAACAAFATLVIAFRRVLAPVEALTAGAQALAGGRLDARVTVSGRDEIGELARSFNAMAAALERNERSRRNMIGDIAHELRTPLTNLRCQIESVQDGIVEGDSHLFASLREETANLTRLVDDLQQLSLAEAGALRLDLEELDVRDVVDRAVAGFDSVQVDLRRGLIVHADLGRTVQIVRNLLTNATQHAKSGVRISGAPRQSFVEITIADDGPGIPPDQQELIFERFHRLDPSRSRSTGGAGLGLAIARELVRLHGGEISVRNGEGGGAEFSFSLPFIRSS